MMPRAYAGRIAQSNAEAHCNSECRSLCTDGRTDGLTENYYSPSATEVYVRNAHAHTTIDSILLRTTRRQSLAERSAA